MGLSAEQRQERDARLIAWIASYLKRKKFAPTVREIGEAFGLSSTSTTFEWLNRLRREGRIDWCPGEVRTIHVKKGKKK